jgi:CheY-like chemotaxis protein
VKKLLVVDDNISVLKQINALLEDRYEFFLAKAGAMALKMCPQIKPDAILLDIEMPEMDGFAVIAQLKADPRLSSIPVVFLSGSTDEATRKQVLESGAADLLAKPVDRDRLIQLLESLLEDSAAPGQGA